MKPEEEYKSEKRIICMTNGLTTRDNDERIKSFFSLLEELSTCIEHLFTEQKPTLNGETFYTDKELREKLKLSRRSLQDYRNEGRLPYIQIGGKILYRASDIEKLLQQAHKGKFK